MRITTGGWTVTKVVGTAMALSCVGTAAQASTTAAERLVGGLPRRDARPVETLDGVDVHYDSFVGPGGGRLRTIITRPAGTSTPLPGLFIVGWLSCDSVESPPVAEPGDGTGLLLQGLARQSGYVTFRVDKPGVGDSEGKCAETDFRTELAAYQAAFRQFRRSPWVIADRIVLVGLSNGGGFAPLVPNGVPVAGYITSGGWSKTWLEHMLEHERRRQVLSGLSPGVVSERMRGYGELYDRYLNGRMTPADVLRERPHLAPLWNDAPAHQYGRPAAFYHQLQELNLLAAWEQVEVPVLAMWGEYDWIMSRDDVQLVVDVVNRRAGGRAHFVELPRMGHSHDVFASQADAFRFRSPQWDDTVVKTMIAWLRALR